MSAAPVVWITGASSGIGAALAIEMADHGWRVAASGRDAARLAALCARRPGRIDAFALEVTDRAANERVAAAVADRLGPIDCAVFNAGGSGGFSVDAFDAEAVVERMTVNYAGAVYGIGAVLAAMRARGRGQIAVTASVAGYRGLPNSAPYTASKAALIALAESLAIDLAGSGVDVTVINPGYVATPMTDRNTFTMPFKIGAARAAVIIRRGLAARRFEIAFPRRMAWLLKMLRHLPYAVYFPLIRRIAKR